MRYGAYGYFAGVVMVLTLVSVGARGEPQKHVPVVDVTSEARPARASVPSGEGSVTANPPEVTPSPEPTATPVEVPLLLTPQPAPAGEAQTEERLVSTEEDAGSIPAASTTLEEAIQAAFPPYQWAIAYAVAMCESRGDPAAKGASGEEGAFQVLARHHGPVPADLYGQAVQAAEIVAEVGWSPWSCAR